MEMQMPNWNELFEQGEFRWEDPDAQVVALAPILQQRGARRVLDLACGAGRHLVYLARAGFQMYGMDIAANGLKYARQWLSREQLTAQLAQSDMNAVPYVGESFDAVICIHAIQHQTRSNLFETTRAILRVLYPGGLFFSTFPSRRDRRFGQGREVEPNTFLSVFRPDVGIPHHYCNLAEIEELLDGFAIMRIELEEHYVEPGNRFSHWQVLAEKE